MNITRTNLSSQNLVRSPQQQVTSAPEESSSFSDAGDSFKSAAGAVAVWGGGLGAGTYAGLKMAQFAQGGGGGIGGAISGLIGGAVTGGATGMGLAAVSEKLDPSDAAGDAMMSGIMTIGGAAVGAVTGAISGFCGSQGWAVAPAVVAAGFGGAMAPIMVMEQFQ